MPCATPEQKAKACALYLRKKFHGITFPIEDVPGLPPSNFSALKFSRPLE